MSLWFRFTVVLKILMKENYEILWELKVAQSSLRKANASQRTKLTLPKTNSLNLPDASPKMKVLVLHP